MRANSGANILKKINNSYENFEFFSILTKKFGVFMTLRQTNGLLTNIICALTRKIFFPN